MDITLNRLILAWRHILTCFFCYFWISLPKKALKPVPPFEIINERGCPLAERNSVVQGIAKGKTYAADIWSREKSFSDVLSDGAEMVDKSVIQPISKASELEVFKLDLLTTSYAQNVEAGRVAAEGGLVLVDTALTLVTASEYAIAKSGKLVKMFSGAARM
ncbi:hypothetical protein QJQ58_24000 [Paenibacillus dendritiformis]|uniref:hypothetical protein n=1 Tax=Paenibacillus dendritiformis TaxID=130049 RepID=UPI00248C6BDE|nr:hypothetical protein [Paenibacillus dendritiformis]WGU93567.1 hypothetical protein QJQ58_24000 [Paenibacillus dendritiformis]